MPRALLQVNFDLDPDKVEPRERTVERAAQHAAEVDGLIWKVWLRDPQRGRGGGLYLFEDRAAAERWAAGRAETMPERMPWTSNVRFELFDVEDELSAITHATLARPA